jgi:SAM-dependent methyltransferase
MLEALCGRVQMIPGRRGQNRNSGHLGLNGMFGNTDEILYFPGDPAVRDILKACPPLEGERYKDGQLIFRQSSNQQKLMLDWLEQNFVARFEQDTIKFLSIGAGTGIFDEQVIRGFLRRDLRIHYEGLDPNQDVLKLLENSLRHLTGEKLTVNTLLSDFEIYQTSKKFNFILLVHTHYFFRDLCQNLQKAWNLLEEGGSIILYSALDIFLSQFFNVTFQSNFGHPPWLSHPVQQVLRTLNIPFRRESINAVLDISACFGQDDKAANDLLSFIIHADTTNTSGRDVLLACLKKNATRENEKFLLPHAVDVFRISQT